MQRFGKVYMKPVKRARTGPGLSSPGEPGADPIETPAVTEATTTVVEGSTVEGTTVEAETAEVAPMEAVVAAVEAAKVEETAEVGTASEGAVVVGLATVEAGVAGPAAVEADKVASGLPTIAEEVESTGGEAAKVGAEPGSGSSSSFGYEDSKEESEETVLEMRSEAGLDEARSTWN